MTETWSPVRRLGKGGQGIVSLEQEQGNDKGALRAVKRVPKSMNAEDDRDGLRELLSLAIFSKDHINFPVFYGWFDDIDYIYIAMEYFKFGDLHQCLTAASAPLPEAEAREICYQLAEALEAIHKQSVTHRDLKPNNVLVARKGPDWWVKLGDFGISKRVQNEETSLHTMFVGAYVAPEVLGLVEMADETAYMYTSAVDIWSLGCVAHWIFTLRDLFRAPVLHRYCLTHKFPDEQIKQCSISEAARHFISRCVDLDPRRRPSSSQMLESGWLTFREQETKNQAIGILSDPQDIGPQISETSTSSVFNSSSFSAPSGPPHTTETLKSDYETHSHRVQDELRLLSNNDIAGTTVVYSYTTFDPQRDVVAQSLSPSRRPVLANEQLRLISELSASYLKGADRFNREIVFPRSVVALPFLWNWCGQPERAGRLKRIPEDAVGIVVIDVSGNPQVYTFAELHLQDLRLVSNWTRTPMETLKRNSKRSGETIKSETLTVPLFYPDWGPLEGEFVMMDDNLITFYVGPTDGIRVWPVEWIHWSTLQKIKDQVEILPERLLQKALFPRYLSQAERDTTKFGAAIEMSGTASENLSSNGLTPFLKGFDLEAVYISGRRVPWWDLMLKEVALVGAAVDKLVADVKYFQVDAAPHQVLGQGIRWTPSPFAATTESQIVDVYHDFVLIIKRRPYIDLVHIASLDKQLKVEILKQVDPVLARRQNPFRRWNMSGLRKELQAFHE